jgi:hypothetical protein
MLALVLLAAAPAWTVTFTISEQADPGNGSIIGTRDDKFVITPSEVTMRHEWSDHGKDQPARTAKGPLAPALRDAIATLLPSLPAASASYSISDTVNDEGGYGEELSVERDGKRLHFSLVQGRGAPPLPKSLADLKALIAKVQFPVPK